MSVKVMAWVFEHSPVKSGNRLTLLALADHANDDGGGCYPSQQTLATHTRMSGRQVRRCLDALEAGGHIVREGIHPRGMVIWRVVMDVRLRSDMDVQVDNLSGRTSATPDPDICDTHPGHLRQVSRTCMPDEPSENHQKQPSKNDGSARAREGEPRTLETSKLRRRGVQPSASGLMVEFVDRRNAAGLGKERFRDKDMAKPEWQATIAELEARHSADDLSAALDVAIREATQPTYPPIMPPDWKLQISGAEAAQSFASQFDTLLGSVRKSERIETEWEELNARNSKAVAAYSQRWRDEQQRRKEAKCTTPTEG